MNKIVSVPSEQQLSKNSPETPPPGVPITSLKKAIAYVNEQKSLSTEMLFKTLLVYYKPDQGLFATRRDPQFLATAIKKESSQGTVSEQTQKKIALDIIEGKFGNDTEVLKAVAGQLAMFTDPTAQFHIVWAIRSDA